jgi:hypothetical protein
MKLWWVCRYGRGQHLFHLLCILEKQDCDRLQLGMKRFEEVNGVRIDIPDRDDPDFARLHRRKGTVEGMFEDDAGLESGDVRDSDIYRISLDDSEETIDVRWRDLRPV